MINITLFVKFYTTFTTFVINITLSGKQYTTFAAFVINITLLGKYYTTFIRFVIIITGDAADCKLFFYCTLHIEALTVVMLANACCYKTKKTCVLAKKGTRSTFA